jgi:predicted anti-sigma-YlaC factor YlaD
MLSCRQITDLITDYLEGRMGFSTRMKFHAHMAMCRRCREYLEQVKMVVLSLGRLPRHEEIPAMSDETCNEMLRTFREWKA